MSEVSKDIFGFNATTGKGFLESERGIFITSNAGGGNKPALALVQDWNIGYQMQTTPIYECGKSTVYWAAKHAAGSLSVTRIVADSYEDVKNIMGNVCKPAEFIIKAYTGRCAGDTVSERASTEVNLIASGSVLTGVSYSGNSQQAYVGEQLTAQFVGLSAEVLDAGKTVNTTTNTAAYY